MIHTRAIAFAFALAAGFGGMADYLGHRPVALREDVVEHVTLKSTYDFRAEFPRARPGDVMGFDLIFAGHQGATSVDRTIEVPCSALDGKNISDEAATLASAFRMTLSSEALQQTEHIIFAHQSGFCGVPRVVLQPRPVSAG